MDTLNKITVPVHRDWRFIAANLCCVMFDCTRMFSVLLRTFVITRRRRRENLRWIEQPVPRAKWDEQAGYRPSRSKSEIKPHWLQSLLRRNFCSFWICPWDWRSASDLIDAVVDNLNFTCFIDFDEFDSVISKCVRVFNDATLSFCLCRQQRSHF